MQTIQLNSKPSAAAPLAFHYQQTRRGRRRSSFHAGKGKQEAESFMGGLGLAGVVGQLADLKLGELLDSPPPGFDESVAISKVRSGHGLWQGL